MKNEIPIEWYTPPGQTTPLVTHIVAQTIEDIIKISFFEIKPPIRLNDNTTVPATKVMAKCITSIFVTQNKLPDFIEVLQKQLLES